MSPTFVAARLPGERAALAGFLTAHEWPYHAQPSLGAADVDDMDLDGDGAATFWIEVDGRRVGLVRLLDLDDIDDGAGAPLFDLRLEPAARGRGIGTAAVHWLCAHLFAAHPSLRRIEATTRDDNVAMQVVLQRCGFEREACYREAWPAGDGTWRDSLAYGLLRRDWMALTAPGS